MDRRQDDRVSSRLVVIAAVGFLLVIPPLLTLFDTRARVLGVPLVWAYLFLIWAITIGLVAATVARSGHGRE